MHPDIEQAMRKSFDEIGCISIVLVYELSANDFNGWKHFFKVQVSRIQVVIK